MMDDREGTGDGECGKGIWVMGSPADGGCGGRDRAPAMATPVVGTGGAENGSSKMAGPEAGSAGMPP